MSTDTEGVALVADEAVANVVRAALFAALTGVLSYVSFQLPVSPVPYTLQVLGVFLAGVFLGPTWGFASLALYVVAGAVGAPVYAYGASGVGQLFSPWGGYLWSYPFAAGLLGYVAHGRDGLTPTGEIPLWRLAAGLGGATVVIYAFGTVGYAVFAGVGLGAAVLAAAVPFVPGEILKGVVAALAARSDRLRAA
ncbi:substrate-specific component BioY of biotin ECF transporter [Halarchaeum acidiphilum MH1-52-1]|uniref:Substrate-specific component BioY of biotin ECF transporter n=1 Tax=Halarchaeum acidiphilum MH1-52-1 TaxID=1261545 RepID=U2YCF5_9EURY|nr:biotin transporter BioY [Halarchaeum acidiphilum]GAD51266.1 substrate-specific component BioY of biotin ECF transporter [Halarchaeum acidiphilum MH1-52-1]